MKKTQFFAFVLAGGMLAACGDNTTHNDAVMPNDGMMEHEHHDDLEDHEDHDAETSEVTLDDGKQWGANPETTTGVANMKQMVNEFDANSDRPAYVALQERLDTEFKMIFEKCTMKGEAHNQLHNYLHPMRDYIDGLSAEDKETRHRSLEMLNERVDEYASYFVTAT